MKVHVAVPAEPDAVWFVVTVPTPRLVLLLVHRPVQDQRSAVAFVVLVTSCTLPPGVGLIGLNVADTVGAGLETVAVALKDTW